MISRPSILALGSVNSDAFMRLDTLPQAGETVTGRVNSGTLWAAKAPTALSPHSVQEATSLSRLPSGATQRERWRFKLCGTRA
jgi:hypothetical protein